MRRTNRATTCLKAKQVAFGFIAPACSFLFFFSVSLSFLPRVGVFLFSSFVCRLAVAEKLTYYFFFSSCCYEGFVAFAYSSVSPPASLRSSLRFTKVLRYLLFCFFFFLVSAVKLLLLFFFVVLFHHPLLVLTLAAE